MAAETIPPSPSPRYLLDESHVLSPAIADDLNNQLEQFERDTSNQIVVVLYPHMQSDDDIADYTTRVFHTWQVGQKGKNNGAVLFIFTNDHKMQIITGYGLEGALPDILCKQIIDNEIAPRFKAGDFNGGVQNGVKAMMAATKGEYKGTGNVVGDNNAAGNAHPIADLWSSCSCGWWLLVLAFFLFIFYGTKRGWISSSPSSGVFMGGGGSSDWSSSSDSGGGGGFSGGGGDTGGGGAGGSW